MAATALIPARFASSRFPGKPLARDTGKYLVQHVYERVCLARTIDRVLIVTDDDRIARVCRDFDAPCRMTSPDHPSGTDRCAEAAADLDANLLVNVQGDEPEIDPAHIDTLVRCLVSDSDAGLATLCAPFADDDDVHNPNIVKVVTDRRSRALYFSRCPIPYDRDNARHRLHRKHIGLYAYRRDTLLQLSRLEPTPLEMSERLEQLRALENGIPIAVAEVACHTVGIDTPDQYQAFVERYRQQHEHSKQHQPEQQA